MPGPVRVTAPLLDVLEVFIKALLPDERELHGWAIMKVIKRSGPTVYGVLDRLEDMRWVTGRWEENAEPGKPRRRFYHLTPAGEIGARELLAQRRPEALRPAAEPTRPAWHPFPRGAGVDAADRRDGAASKSAGDRPIRCSTSGAASTSVARPRRPVQWDRWGHRVPPPANMGQCVWVA